MKINITFDDSAARLPLTIRSSDNLWDRSSDLRNAPGIELVERTTQHALNTGASLFDELAYYFDHKAASEPDPYRLAQCYANRAELEDLWRLLGDDAESLVGLHEVERLFPADYARELPFILALTAVGVDAFGYVRTYQDSEGEEFHGMVVNLAEARPHLEDEEGNFSLGLLRETIRHGFFNHEGFLLAYHIYCQDTDREGTLLIDRLKHALLSRGIAWHLSYRQSPPPAEALLPEAQGDLDEQIACFNRLLGDARQKRAVDDLIDPSHTSRRPGETCIDLVGYHAARHIVEHYGEAGLQAAIAQGPDHFITLFNALGAAKIQPVRA